MKKIILLLVFICLSAGAYATNNWDTAKIIAAWDDSTNDDLGNYNPTVNGTVTGTVQIKYGSLAFSGWGTQANNMEMADALTTSMAAQTAWTIQAWVYLPSNATDIWLSRRQDTGSGAVVWGSFGSGTDNRVAVQIGTSGWVVYATLTKPDDYNKWMLVSICWNGASVKIYHDGTLKGTIGSVTTNPFSVGNITDNFYLLRASVVGDKTSGWYDRIAFANIDNTGNELTPLPATTATNTPTITLTNTPTITQTITQTNTETNTPTITQTITPTVTQTITPGNIRWIYWSEATPCATFFPRDKAVALTYNNYLWLMSGNPADNFTPILSDVWQSNNGADWTATTLTAGWGRYSPDDYLYGRFGATALNFNNKMWVIGGRGYDGSLVFNDAWYSTDGIDWHAATCNAAYPHRSLHSSVVFNNKMWVIGGHSDYGPPYCSNDAWYSTDGIDWQDATQNAEFEKRESFVSVVYNNKIWVIGGTDENGNYFSDAWSSSNGSSWARSTSTTPFNGDALAGWVFDNKIIIYDGPNQTAWYSTDGINWVYIFNVNTPPPTRREAAYTVYNNAPWILTGYHSNGTSGDLCDVWRMGIITSETPTVTLTPTLTITMTPTITPTPVYQKTLYIPATQTGNKCIGWPVVTGALGYYLIFNTGYTISVPVYSNVSTDSYVFWYTLNLSTLPNRTKITYVQEFVKKSIGNTGQWQILGPDPIWSCDP